MNSRLVIVAFILAVVPACRENRDAAGRPSAPTDSLYRLYRQLLVDTNPHAVQQAIVCEGARLTDRFGLKPGLDSMEAAEKAAYGWRDRRRLNHVLDGLHGHVFDLDEKACGKFVRTRRDSTASNPR